MYDPNEIKNYLASHKTSFIPFKYTPPELPIKPSYFLASQKEFSDSFLDYIGFRHITYYDDEFGRILLQFFRSYIEHYTNNFPLYLNKIKDFPTNNLSSPYFLLHKLWNNPTEVTTSNLKKNWYYAEPLPNQKGIHQCESDSLAEIITKILNINFNDSYATIAKLLNISYHNFYSHTNIGDPSQRNFDSPILEIIPDNLKIPQYPAYEFNLLISQNILNYNEKILSKICSYQINHKYITLTTSTSNDSILAFGHTQPHATFYNFTKIDNHPNFYILFFQNISQALAYENILQQHKVYPSNFVITGHNSNDLEMLDWSLLAHKNLIFICETKKKAYEEINYYKYHFDKYAINFKIFPYPLLFNELGWDCNKQPNFNNLSNIEQNLLTNALYMDNNLKDNDRILFHDSLEFNKFIRWGNELGLFSKYQAEENFFAYSPLPDTDSEEFEDNIHNIPLNSLFLNNSITLLHAPTETGKSIFALAVAKALLDSSQFLFFKTSQVQPNILILDGETPSDVFSKRLKQLLIDKNHNSLITISIPQEKNEKQSSLWSNMDLSKEECRDQLTTFIKAKNITFIILDNLSCLVRQNLNTDKLPQEIFNWLHQLVDQCSVLLIHHTKQDGSKVRGSQLWSNKAPSEIQLINIRNDQRAIKRYKTISNDYLPQTKQAFCGVRFNKTKSYPILQNQIFWITLPLNQPEWKLVTITDMDGKILEDNLPIYSFPNLDKRENLILSKTKETFTAKDAENIIKKKRGTVLKCLKNLQNKGYIKKEGTIKSTYYIKTEKVNENDTTKKSLSGE